MGKRRSEGREEQEEEEGHGAPRHGVPVHGASSVSYTHLTLPTILLV